ncbi:myocyte-specific enhancer factor 2D [Xiphias gladius]|uniref:myocyte-specific enhancer factor 2D n=1 Tax=Xiphias gladius TaxID=8245 RepID=UPI001A995101|nr:myocyte-specific enhancer factor 2D [Xiphias gladius]
MGRKKIQIQRITDERNRQVTFTKRKFGLMKKAYELSVLCDCEIALIIFNHSNKLFQYASTDMDKVLLKYTEYNEPHESRTNADIIETLRKKGFNGCNSPEPDGDDSIDQSPLNDDKYRKTEDLDSLFKRYGALNKKEHRDSESPDPEEPFSLTPRTEEKYKKIDEEFDKMMQNYRLSVSTPPLCNTAPSSSNGYISARASPGLLSVSNGNSLGKVVPAKSPPPPSPQMVNSRKPDLRVITSQSGKSLMQLTEEELELNAQRLGGSQVAQPLTTPVVSVATPSLLAPFSGMQTAYNTEYQLTSADLTALQTFTPPGLVPGNMAAWQQQQQPAVSQQQQQQQQPQQLSLASLSNLVPVGHIPQGAALTVNTNPNVNIKSEPISPNRDRSTPSSTSAAGGGGGGGGQGQVQGQGLVSVAYPGTLRLEAGGQGRSPVDSLSSNGSSYEGSDRDDGIQGRAVGPEFHHQAGAGAQQPTMVLLRPSSAEPQEQDGTNVKRMRLDTWVT